MPEDLSLEIAILSSIVGRQPDYVYNFDKQFRIVWGPSKDFINILIIHHGKWWTWRSETPVNTRTLYFTDKSANASFNDFDSLVSFMSNTFIESS